MVKITVYVEAVNKQKMFTIEQWGKPFENFFVESDAAFENPNFFFKLHCTLPWNGIFLYSVQCLINEKVDSLLANNYFRKLEIWVACLLLLHQLTTHFQRVISANFLHFFRKVTDVFSLLFLRLVHNLWERWN